MLFDIDDHDVSAMVIPVVLISIMNDQDVDVDDERS